MARKLFDCFLFFNELDILEIRLRETADVVDHFVVVESTLTFQGKPKPLHFKENATRFAPWANKIIHVVVSDDNSHAEKASTDAWRREHYQRNQVVRGLKDATPADLVMVSDVDEITRANVLRRIKSDLVPGTGYVLYQRMYYGHFNRREVKTSWPGPRIVEKNRFRTGQVTRRLKAPPHAKSSAFGLDSVGVRLRNLQICGSTVRMIGVPDSGWHFSSIGTYETWRAKVDAFSHTECKEWSSYQSAEGYRQWLAGHSIDPLDAMPHAVRDDPRFADRLSAPAGVS